MDHVRFAAELLNDIRTADLPDEFILAIRFNIDGEEFFVGPHDIARFRENRPKDASRVRFYPNIDRMAEAIRIETEYLMARAWLMTL